jgi:polar amino acid transport system substrate-binding protein
MGISKISVEGKTMQLLSFRWLLPAAAAIFTMVGAAQSAVAATLDEIISRGKIVIGIDVNSPPYGFQNEKQEFDGSEVETAKMLAKDLGVTLEIVPTTVANRVPYLTSARVDAIMASFAITPERAKSVWFSTPYGTTGSIIIGAKSANMKDFAAMAGKKIATTRGSAAEIALGARTGDGYQLVRLDDDSGATAALVSGQTDALVTTPAIAQTIFKRFPDRQYEEKFSVLKFWYGVGVQRGNVELLQWLNTSLMFNIQNGNISKINEKWMGSPLKDIPTL